MKCLYESTEAVNKKEIEKAVDIVTKFTAKNSPMPALSCVKVTAQDKTLYIRATNLLSGITAKIQTGGGGFDLIVSADKLKKALKVWRHDHMMLRETETDGKQYLTLEGNGSSIKVEAIVANDVWPQFPSVDSSSCTLDASAFIPALKLAVPIASKEETRSIQNVCFDPDQEGLNIVSTDGHRMVHQNYLCTWPIDSAVLLPANQIKLLFKVFGKEEITVRADPQVGVEFQSSRFSCWIKTDLDASKYPPWRKLIPTDPPISCTLRRDIIVKLASAIKTTSDFPHKDLYIYSKNGNMFFRSADTEECQIDENTGALFDPGADWRAKVNGAYLAEMCSLVDDDKVQMCFDDDALSPVMIKPAQGNRFTMVLMPLRL